MIEPINKGSDNPVIDDITCRVTYAMRHATYNGMYRGFHRCVCGATSDNKNWRYNDLQTNSLAVHYVAFHRDEISESEIEKIKSIPAKDYPTPDEIYRKKMPFNG